MIRKGFTLIELLIVIVVIGILSAMMYMSSAESISTANATKIVNDLRMLQTAAMHWYFDNEANLVLTDNGYQLKLNEEKIKFHDAILADGIGVKKYISNPNFALNTGKKDDWQNMYAAVGGYSVYLGFSNTVCYVAYRISGDDKMKDNARLRDKLKGRAKTAKLVYYNFNGGKEKSKETLYNGENFVCMRVFVLDDKNLKTK